MLEKLAMLSNILENRFALESPDRCGWFLWDPLSIFTKYKITVTPANILNIFKIVYFYASTRVLYQQEFCNYITEHRCIQCGEICECLYMSVT